MFFLSENFNSFKAKLELSLLLMKFFLLFFCPATINKHIKSFVTKLSMLEDSALMLMTTLGYNQIAGEKTIEEKTVC